MHFITTLLLLNLNIITFHTFRNLISNTILRFIAKISNSLHKYIQLIVYIAHNTNLQNKKAQNLQGYKAEVVV